MNRDLLLDLRCAGYQPRSLLDIGAHVGQFTRNFLAVFPGCVPTLVEPNPHCQEALARLPYERHAVAASDKAGRAELFLTAEWLQSTGTSLYRENTDFFRDEVLRRHEVETLPLDSLFAERGFDFVKIDTQGSELDILRGGRNVLRQADHILIEISMVDYNIGGARAEAVFAELTGMGFRGMDVAEFHRLAGVRDGNLLQVDVLFARQARRPAWCAWSGGQGADTAILSYLRRQVAANAAFSVVGMGVDSRSSFAAILAARVSESDGCTAPADLAVAWAGEEDWRPLLRHVARHGRFSYAICDRDRLDASHAMMMPEILPLIAEAGYIRQADGTRGITWSGGLPIGALDEVSAMTGMTQPKGFHQIDGLMAEGRALEAAEALLAMKEAGADSEAVLARIRLLANPVIHQFNDCMSRGDVVGAVPHAEVLTKLLPGHAGVREAAQACMQAAARHASPAPPEPDARHPLIRLRDLHDAAGAILCGQLDAPAEARVRDLRQAARVLAIDVPAGSEWAAWERHYRLMLEAADPALLANRWVAEEQVPEGTTVWTPDGERNGWPQVRAVLDMALAETGAEVVFFAAADAAYVDLYGRWYVQSILRHCDIPCAVVLHVIGGGGTLRAMAERLDIHDRRLILCGDRFRADAATTRCHDAPPRGTSAKPLAHLQSARFLLLEPLSRAARRPIFVSDIDLILQRGVADLLTGMAGCDVVLNENTLNRNAGSRITANLLLVNPTPGAAVFLGFLRRFLEQALGGTDVSRWIDQIGLLMARHYARRHAVSARFGYFDTARDINNVIYKAYTGNPFRFLSLYHGFDLSSLGGLLEKTPGGADAPSAPVAA